MWYASEKLHCTKEEALARVPTSAKWAEIQAFFVLQGERHEEYRRQQEQQNA
jgi:hypothetical protein